MILLLATDEIVRQSLSVVVVNKEKEDLNAVDLSYG